jgi:membrane-associated HD superfamily phosphohydrolase
MDELVNVIEHNDEELKKREDLLIQKVNHAYEKAVKGAIKDFRYLMKLNDKVKPTNKQVAKILDNMIRDFRDELETLIEPFQKELVKQYEEGLIEAGQVLAFRELKEK